MNRPRRLWAFIGAGALQLAVPLAHIALHEQVLRDGRAYRFVCAPVDPADVFRGRYVAIELAAASVTQQLDHALAERRWVVAPIEVGADGYAWFGRLSERPPHTGDWIRARCRWAGKDVTVLQLPCDRFYLSESAAPDVEREYRRSIMRGATGAPPVAVVRVSGGRAVVEDLELGGVPLREWLRRRRTDPP